MHKVLRDTFAVQIKCSISIRARPSGGSPQEQSDLGLHLISLISQIISSPEAKAFSIPIPLASVRMFARLSVICQHFQTSLKPLGQFNSN